MDELDLKKLSKFVKMADAMAAILIDFAHDREDETAVNLVHEYWIFRGLVLDVDKRSESETPIMPEVPEFEYFEQDGPEVSVDAEIFDRV